MRLAYWGLAIVLFTPAGIASAQQQSDQQQDALAAAARHAREQKKQQAKSTKVWTNDDIPGAGPADVTGRSEPAASDAVSGNAGNAGDKPSTSEPASAKNSSAADKRTSVEADLASAKETLQSLQNDLDILQRKFTLDQQMYYGKPEYSSDKAGAAALKDEQDQIDAKQQEMEDAQKKVAELQSQLNSANTDADVPAHTDSDAPAK